MDVRDELVSDMDGEDLESEDVAGETLIGWEDRVREFLTEKTTGLPHAGDEGNNAETDKTGAGDENIDNTYGEWLSATRHDVFFAPADAHLQMYIVSKPVEQRNGKSEVIDVSIPFIEMGEKESIDSFMKRAQEASFDVSISKTVSDKTSQSGVACCQLSYLSTGQRHEDLTKIPRRIRLPPFFRRRSQENRKRP